MGQTITSTQIIAQKQPNLKERAGQGDVEAIKQLLNIALQHKNITVKASLKNECLQIKLEYKQIPEQALVILIRREIIMLKLEFIKTVKIYAQPKDNDFPDWTQEFELQVPKNPRTYTTSKSKNQDITLSFNEKTLGILGPIILFIGVFTPIVNVPIIGDINYLYRDKGDGLILLILIVISLALAFREKYKLLWWTGGASFVVVIVGLINFLTRIDQLQSNVDEQLSDDPFKGLANAAVQLIELQWGWIILILGVGLM